MIWRSSTGIPSPPLALFAVMLPKAHWTLHSSISGSRWVITPSDYLGHENQSSSVYFHHLFLISSASVRSIPFVSFIEPIFVWNVPRVSLVFLKRSLDFPILLLSSLHLSRRKAFLSLLPILWNSAFRWLYLSFSPLPFSSFFSQLFVRPPQTNILPFCLSFSWGWSWYLLPVQCHEPLLIVLQALYLSHLIPWIYLSLPLDNCKGFDLCHTS